MFLCLSAASSPAENQALFINIVQNTICHCSADISHVTDSDNQQKYFIFRSC